MIIAAIGVALLSFGCSQAPQEGGNNAAGNTGRTNDNAATESGGVIRRQAYVKDDNSAKNILQVALASED